MERVKAFPVDRVSFDKDDLETICRILDNVEQTEEIIDLHYRLLDVYDAMTRTEKLSVYTWYDTKDHSDKLCTAEVNS